MKPQFDICNAFRFHAIPASWPDQRDVNKIAEKYAGSCIRTVADFLRLYLRKVRDIMSVVSARVQAEFRGGLSCPSLSLMAP